LSLKFREEHRLRVLGNIFEAKSWKEQDKGENSKQQPSSIFEVIKLRRTGLAGHVAHMEKKKNAYRVLVGRLSA
jgi:hypothetical protein